MKIIQTRLFWLALTTWITAVTQAVQPAGVRMGTGDVLQLETVAPQIARVHLSSDGKLAPSLMERDEIVRTDWPGCESMMKSEHGLALLLSCWSALGVEPDYSWINQTAGPRPKYVWENREDTIYHEMWYPDTNKVHAPEIQAIMRGPWVFNRAMKWIDAANDTVIAFSEGGDLALTGDRQVSRWYSDPANQVSTVGDALRFVKRTDRRRRDCVVLPAFQFHLGQHPLLRLDVKEASDDWQLVVSIKGRSGAPFVCSGWQRGAKSMEFDLARRLRELGYDLNYAELHFVVGLWPQATNSPAHIEFSASLCTQPAVIGCLPVIRTADRARKGVPITALVRSHGVDNPGPHQVRVVATVNGRSVPLRETEGVWASCLTDLPIGNHLVTVTATPTPGTAPARFEPTTVWVRVTDGDFARYDAAKNLIQLGGKHVKPLTGSFQGTFFYRDAGLKSEQLVNTQKEWDDWDRAEPPGEHMHYWESMTSAELAARFSHLARNGWDLVHLHSHYGIWERFDAFGHPAPHGVEQLAAYVRAANQSGLRVMVTLSSYPYSVNTHNWDEGTTPYAQTLENGFRNEDWYRPANEPFNSQYRRYLRSMVGLLRDESGIFSWSSSGEGDWKNGPDRFLDTQRTIRSVDRDHLIVSEPVMHYTMLPRKQVEPFPSDLVGNRNYVLGGVIPFEQDMSIVCRLNRMVPNAYLAEGSFPSSSLYTSMTGNGTPYVGTAEYRRHVRDTFYLGLVHRMPLMMTWDEVFTEDEHRVLAQARTHFDWTQPLLEPAVAVLIGDAEASGANRAQLGELEAAFARLPLDYRFIAERQEAQPGEVVIDGREPLDLRPYTSFDSLPENLRRHVPFRLSLGWSAAYCATRDRRCMLAYIYNTADQATWSFYLGAKKHRSPRPVELSIELPAPPTSHVTLFDLETKQPVSAMPLGQVPRITLEPTSHDFLLLISDASGGVEETSTLEDQSQ